MSRNEELVIQKLPESEQLMAPQIQSRSIEIAEWPTKRRPYSLSLNQSSLGESAQETTVGSESAPALSQNFEYWPAWSETPAQDRVSLQ